MIFIKNLIMNIIIIITIIILKMKEKERLKIKEFSYNNFECLFNHHQEKIIKDYNKSNYYLNYII